MKALILENPHVAKYVEIPVRPIKDDEILIKVAFAGVCGTDYALYTGETNLVREGLAKYPIRIGHEWSGIVERTGTAVTRFKSGDRVIGDNSVTCGTCPACRNGDYHLCSHTMAVGTINCWDGCFADYIIMPERHLYHIPDSISLEEAALIEPATISYSALKKNDLEGKTVALIGTGPIGLAGIPMAKSLGARLVVMIGRTPLKLEIARRMGADHVIRSTTCDANARMHEITGGKGADIVLEASGAISSIIQACDIVAQRGFVYLLAFYEKAVHGWEVDRFIFKEARMSGIMGEFGLPRLTAEAMEKHRFSFLPMVTHHVSFNEISGVLENWESMKDRVKVMVRF